MLCCSELPTLEKGYKKTTKKELLSPSERHTKAKKNRQILPEEASPTTQHIIQLLQLLLY